MRLETRKYLYDIQRACKLLSEFTAGKTFADYESSAMQRSAVERQFEVIGEAMNRLARVDDAVVSGITEYRRIVAFRNLLTHGYDVVDDRLVWDVVQTDLPILTSEIDTLLEET